MKLVVVIPNLRGSGCERIVSNLLPGFGEKWNVVLITYDADVSYAIPPNIRRVSLGSKNIGRLNSFKKASRFLWRIYLLCRVLVNERPDVVLSFMDTCNAVTFFATKLAAGGAPIVSAEHTMGEEIFRHNAHAKKFRGILIWLLNYVYNRVDGLIVISNAMKTFLETHGLKKKAAIIYNGFSTNKFQPDKNFLETVAERVRIAPRILNVGMLSDNKNQELLLNALVVILKNIPGARLTVVGEGELRSHLANVCRTLGILDSVVFEGWQKNVEKYYRAADLLVHTSRYESFGNVLVEAFFSGVPAVATPATPAYNEVFFSEECGVITKSWDASELALQMLAVLKTYASDANVRTDLAARAREKFSFDVTQKGYQDAIAAVIPDKRVI